METVKKKKYHHLTVTEQVQTCTSTVVCDSLCTPLKTAYGKFFIEKIKKSLAHMGKKDNIGHSYISFHEWNKYKDCKDHFGI